MPTGKVTAGRSPIHNHRQGFFVHAMVDFIQILFATERMLDSTEGPAQKRPGPQYSYLTGIRVSVALAPKPLERKEISMQVHSILQGESLNQDLQTDARQHIAAIARWDNEGGACNVLSKKTDAELKKRPRSKRNDREPTDG
jgi:hypothetical protein